MYTPSERLHAETVDAQLVQRGIAALPVSEETTRLLSAQTATARDYSVRRRNRVEPDTDEVYERILLAERSLFAPENTDQSYITGTAKVEDELLKIDGASGLLSAEHSTAQIRNGRTKTADIGVGGLMYVLAQDTGVSAVAMTGRQTSDANYYPDHPLKQAITEHVTNGDYRLFSSIHGTKGWLFTPYLDRTMDGPFDIHIGIGVTPNQATIEFAGALVANAVEMGLTVGVNQPVLRLQNNDEFATYEQNGHHYYQYQSFSGANVHSTVHHAGEAAQHEGIEDFVSLQVELGDHLRLPQPYDDRRNRNGSIDMVRVKEGVYLGYRFIRSYIETQLGSSEQ